MLQDGGADIFSKITQQKKILDRSFAIYRGSFFVRINKARDILNVHRELF